jgi:hypothetical protein
MATTLKGKRVKKSNGISTTTVRHTLYLREDLNGDFLILCHLKISDFTKMVNHLASEAIEKHKTEIENFKNRKK